MRKISLTSVLIWFIFINLAPVGIVVSSDSTIGSILKHVEPFNNSQNVTSKSPSLIEGILKGTLVVTPDAGASIGQIDYVSKSMQTFKFPTWDPYMQSGRPMFPADGYNTGIFDPFQFMVSFLPLDIVQKIAIISAIWTFVFIFFSFLIFRFFTNNPWAQIIGLLMLVSSKAFHYVPNHLITLGAWVCGVITFYLVLRLLRATHARTTLGIAFLLGLSLLNFSAFGLGMSVFIFGCGFLTLVTQTGLFSKRVLNYLLHVVFSISIALPHVLKMRETQSTSTNSQIPYVSKAGGLVENLNRFGSRITIPIFIFCFLILMFTCFALWLNKCHLAIVLLDKLRTNTGLRLCAITFSLAVLGLAGIFEKLNYQIGLNIQSVNLFPLPLTIALASFLTYFLTYLNERLRPYANQAFLNRLIFPILAAALFLSPFNAVYQWRIGNVFFLIFLVFTIWYLAPFKENTSNNSFLIFVISIWISLIPVAHQFYGTAFSVQTYNKTIRKQICSAISCSSSYRFLAIHSTDSSGVPVLTNENANSFIYYPTTSSLYGFYEASGGLSLNSVDYANFMATINEEVFIDSPRHPGSKQFLSKIQEKTLQREDIDFETAVKIQNRRNNNLVWNPNSSLLRYLSVKYIISTKELPATDFYFLDHKFIDLKNLGREMSYKLRSHLYYVYQVRNPIARVSFPSEVVLRNRDDAQTLKDLSSTSSYNLAIVDSKNINSTAIGVFPPGRVISQKVLVNGLRIHTIQANSQYLLINESFHPGWTAKVNGKKIDIQRANSVFMAVKLPEGENHLELSFQVFNWREDFFLLVIPCIILLSLRFFRLRRIYEV